MDILATQAAIILGGTGFIGKFITDPEDRDVLLPIIAALLGVLSSCVLHGAWDISTAVAGLVVGGSVTGLYSIASGDGRKKASEESVVPINSHQ